MKLAQIVATLCLAAMVLVFVFFGIRAKLHAPSLIQTHYGAITQIREMGDLVAFSAFFKDVGVSKESDSWYKKGKKMMLICEFDIEYRYNLQLARFEPKSSGVRIVLPPCRTKTSISNVNIYDEQDGLYPILGGYGSLIKDRITTEERNAMIQAAQSNALTAARSADRSMLTKAEASARKTILAIATGLGLGKDNVDVVFSPTDPSGSEFVITDR